MNKRITLFSAVLCLMTGSASAQISITNSTPYTQDFNTLPTVGVASANPTPANWYRYDNPSSTAKDTIRVTAGTTTSGGFYSVGTGTNADRAFGMLLSGSTKPLYLGAKFINNTGSTIVSADVSYRCEQWRRGNNIHVQGHADSLLVEYNSGTDSVQKGVWTNVSGLMGTSTNTDTIVGALDGNAVFQTKTFTVTGMSVPSGGVFWIRFSDYDIGGSEDILAVDDFSAAFTTGVVSHCTEPASSVTNVVLNANGTSVNGSFTGTTADAYLVVIDSVAPAPTITDAVTYTVGQAIGTGKVAANGTSTSFSLGGLVASTIYHAYVFPYNNLGCSGGPNYKTTSPGTDTAKTGAIVLSECTQPSGVSNASIIKLDSTTTTISIKFTFPPSADSVMVLAGPTATIGFVQLHDSIAYLVGSTIPGSGAKVYTRGTADSAVLTGLTINTVYKIIIVSFNNKNCTFGPNYAGLASTTIRTAAGAAGECTQPTGVSNSSITKTDSTATTISFHFTLPANADSVMILAGPTATIGFVTLHDSVFYAVNSTIPGSGAKVYARGVDTAIVLTGLIPNTVYKIIIVSFNNKACTFGPNYAGLASTTIRTAITTGIRNRSTEAEFSLYPNPVSNGSLFVKFKGILKEDAVIEVVDISGRKVISQDVSMVNDLQSIDVSNLAKGTYLLNVIYKGTNNVSTFMKE